MSNEKNYRLLRLAQERLIGAPLHAPDSALHAAVAVRVVHEEPAVEVVVGAEGGHVAALVLVHVGNSTRSFSPRREKNA